ncbi:MAG: hypothetical protein Ct9H300mP1_04070 [Planctomycetaceae bacterium]|nr:MAG: hypothetical protein Ct9H300mP1_04070 [Planctomycetaceae bacterium]
MDLPANDLDPNLVKPNRRRRRAAIGGRSFRPAGPAEAVANEIVCRELIVTGELLAGRISPEVRPVRISAGAILTPTAQELVKKNELTVTVDAKVSAAGDSQPVPGGLETVAG